MSGNEMVELNHNTFLMCHFTWKCPPSIQKSNVYSCDEVKKRIGILAHCCPAVLGSSTLIACYSRMHKYSGNANSELKNLKNLEYDSQKASEVKAKGAQYY